MIAEWSGDSEPNINFKQAEVRDYERDFQEDHFLDKKEI